MSLCILQVLYCLLDVCGFRNEKCCRRIIVVRILLLLFWCLFWCLFWFLMYIDFVFVVFLYLVGFVIILVVFVINFNGMFWLFINVSEWRILQVIWFFCWMCLIEIFYVCMMLFDIFVLWCWLNFVLLSICYFFICFFSFDKYLLIGVVVFFIYVVVCDIVSGSKLSLVSSVVVLWDFFLVIFLYMIVLSNIFVFFFIMLVILIVCWLFIRLLLICLL